MTTTSEAIRLNLEFYRKQAKALLKSAQSGDTAALDRITRHQPERRSAAPALHRAQLAIAREQGFASWPRFRAFIIQSQLPDQNLVAQFIAAAVSDLRRAEELLAAHPMIAAAGFFVALVLGDWKQVERALVENTAQAHGKSGPQKCEPLVYVCFSRYASAKSDRAPALVETASVLLRHGADANAFAIVDDYPDNPLPCLYAATGLNNNPSLGRVLLEAGANPNDSESLYHSTEHGDLACVRLLLAHGAVPARANALKHMLDREDLEGVQLLLAAGADPNEVNGRGETALHWAVWRGRGTAIISALLERGVNLEAKRQDGRTAYALAVQSGQTEVAALLEARGAKQDLSALDRFLGACTTAGPEELKRLLASQPEILASPGAARLLPDFAMSHRTSAVRALLAAGVPIHSKGDLGGTALHWACWKGYADLVEFLLHAGASLAIEDDQFHGTPPGWFGHGVQNCHEGSGDYPQTAQLLIGAGARFAPADLPTGNPEVDAILREHGLI